MILNGVFEFEFKFDNHLTDGDRYRDMNWKRHYAESVATDYKNFT